MRTVKKIFTCFSIVLIALSLSVGIAFAATDSHMPGMGNGNIAAAPTAADRDSFKTIWKKALDSASLTKEQQTRLAMELETISKKLAENYMGLDDLLKQQKAGKGTATSQKRIDLKEAERDLIISQGKVKLEEFLTKDQVGVLSMAAFHGVSMSWSGAEHITSMVKEMIQNKNDEPLATELGKLADKLNQNCQAVTLEIIRESLPMVSMK